MAATRTWVGPTLGGNWNTAANWGGTVPTSLDIAAFNTAPSINFNPASATVGQLSGAVILGGTGNTLTIAGVSGIGITGNITDNISLNTMNITVSNAQTWSASTTNSSGIAIFINSGNLTLNAGLTIGNGTNGDFLSLQFDTSGIVSGTGSLTIAANATADLSVLNMANTYTGGTVVNGRLFVSGNSTGAVTSGPVGRGTLTINSGGELVTIADTSLANALRLNGNVLFGNGNSSNTVTFTGATTLTAATTIQGGSYTWKGGTLAFNGIISGAFALGVDSTFSGNLNFGGANTFTGNFTLNSPNTTVGVDASTTGTGSPTNGPLGRGTVILTSGSLQALTTARTLSNAININGSVTVTGSQDLTFSSTTNAVTGTGLLTKSGSSVLTFAGSVANTNTGGITITAGTVTFNKTANIAAIGNGGTITIDSGAALNLAAAGQFTSRTAVNMNLNGGILYTNGNTISSGNVAIGTLTLSANSVIDLGTGATILKYADSSATSWASGAALTINNWTGNSAGGGTDGLFFGTASTGLTSSQVSQITFWNPNINGVQQSGLYNAIILSTGEVVPGSAVPEPSTYFMGAALIGVLILWEVRRRYF